MEIELTIAEFKAIQKEQGWTDDEARRWLNDEEPLPDVRYPAANVYKLLYGKAPRHGTE